MSPAVGAKGKWYKELATDGARGSWIEAEIKRGIGDSRPIPWNMYLPKKPSPKIGKGNAADL